ncbi:SGNH/GDSL hydrolase family protein [Pedobacter segetis]|nr:SGNH/GDSL hydrolase family protein [Pedobacter segetis]
MFLLLVSFINPKPKILIIGDSISIGYTPFVKSNLKDEAEVIHCKGNAKFTDNGIAHLDEWLGTEKWDIIQFNWGLWDICYRDPNKPAEYTNRDKIKGKITTDKKTYEANLQTMVNRLKQTDAKLIFVTTTYVPDQEIGRYNKDVMAYNAIAKQVMKRNNIVVNDLYAVSKQIHDEYGLNDTNVHYKKEGYLKLAVTITEGLTKLLK